MNETQSISTLLKGQFGENALISEQLTADATLTLWVGQEYLREILKYLKNTIPQPYHMLFDLCAIDERKRTKRDGQPTGDFTIVYHLTSQIGRASCRERV